MNWYIKDDRITCEMDADEFTSLKETLQEMALSEDEVSLQIFPADYAAIILKSMEDLKFNREVYRVWRPWSHEEEAILRGAWEIYGNLPRPHFIARLRRTTDHEVLKARTNKAIDLRMAKMGLTRENES